LYFHVRTQK
jgi:hypothetical protein